MPERFLIGCMSGTSLDGLDVALVRVTGRGLSMHGRFEQGRSTAFEEVAVGLRRLARGEALRAAEVAALSHDFSRLHVRAIQQLLDGANLPAASVALIALHGQTVFHAPPLSWQLIQPAPIASAFGVPVVHDLRAADLAAGGQGAPITPIADALLFGLANERVLVLNLGGFANFTLIPDWPSEQVRRVAALETIDGGDICICNQLLDALAQGRLNAAFDRDGGTALKGSVHEDGLRAVGTHLTQQSSAGRSLGSRDESLTALCERLNALSAADALRTACRAIALTIAARVPRADVVYAAGGGAHNEALLAELRAALGCRVNLTDRADVPLQYREAVEMALLGALCADRVQIALPRVTQRTRRTILSGSWTPGAPASANEVDTSF